MQTRSAQIIATSLLLLGLGAPAAFAESGDTLTGTGTLATPGEEFRAVWSERSEGFRMDVLKTRSTIDALRAKMTTTRDKRAAERRACRESLRRANRDARLGVLLQCYADDLAATRVIFGLQREEAALLPGVSPAVRSIAVQRFDVLDDAIQTILDGVDVGVFATEEEALETKHNLRERYVLPAFAALADARTDRLQAWIAHLGTRLLTARETAEHTMEIDAVLTCLIEAQALVAGVLDKESNGGNKTTLSQAQSTLKSCVTQMQTAIE